MGAMAAVLAIFHRTAGESGSTIHIMSRRREANRAEAIVRGIGAIIMLLILAAMVYAIPQILKGKSTDEMIRTMLHILMGLAVLAGAVTVIGLIVWFKRK